MKKILCCLLALALIPLAGCTAKKVAAAEKATVTYYDYFDTVTTVTVYGASEETINELVTGVFGRPCGSSRA